LKLSDVQDPHTFDTRIGQISGILKSLSQKTPDRRAFQRDIDSDHEKLESAHKKLDAVFATGSGNYYQTLVGSAGVPAQAAKGNEKSAKDLQLEIKRLTDCALFQRHVPSGTYEVSVIFKGGKIKLMELQE